MSLDLIVDTGSSGVRILSQALGSVSFPSIQSSGGALAECVQFGTYTSWGSVNTASVTMGGEPAVTVPIQIIDASFGSSSPPSPCNAMQADSNSLGGASGLLGIAPFQSDTGFPGGVNYFTCQNQTCAPANSPSQAQTVQNPAFLLPTDNNGVFVRMSPISPRGASQGVGDVIFGIGTNLSNTPQVVSNGNPYNTVASSSLQFDTFLYNPPFLPGNIYGQPFFTSAIDTGSNQLFFDDSKIPQCALPCPFGNALQCISYNEHPVMEYCPTTPQCFGFFCSTTLTNPSFVGLDATVGPCNSSTSCPQTPIDFQVGDGLAFESSGDIAFNDLGAPIPFCCDGGSTFLWGLPFFFGKSVFIAYGNTPFGSAPMWGFAPFVSYSQVVVEIATGNDDLRSDSEAVATFSGQSAPLCLKASDAGTDNWGPNGAPACPQNPNAQEWPNNSVDDVVNNPFPLGPGVVTFGTMSITLIQHPRGWEGWDNWDIAGINVTALDPSGNPTVILSLGSLFPNSGVCVARLKNGRGIDTVTFQLMAPTVGNGFGPGQTTGTVLSGNTNCND